MRTSSYRENGHSRRSTEIGVGPKASADGTLITSGCARGDDLVLGMETTSRSQRGSAVSRQRRPYSELVRKTDVCLVHT